MWRFVAAAAAPRMPLLLPICPKHRASSRCIFDILCVCFLSPSLSLSVFCPALSLSSFSVCRLLLIRAQLCLIELEFVFFLIAYKYCSAKEKREARALARSFAHVASFIYVFYITHIICTLNIINKFPKCSVCAKL